MAPTLEVAGVRAFPPMIILNMTRVGTYCNVCFDIVVFSRARACGILRPHRNAVFVSDSFLAVYADYGGKGGA